MARVNVDGTRRVLDAAAAVGVRKVIRVSSAAVYGAWPNNPVPLTEDAPLRPNPGFSPAVQAAEVERLLGEWRDEHPAVTVTTLRTAPVLGARRRAAAVAPAARPPAAAGPGRRARRCRSSTSTTSSPRWRSRCARTIPGTFNVAADGWLERTTTLRALLPALARARAARPSCSSVCSARLWASGLGDVPPSVVPYLVHPWVDRQRPAARRSAGSPQHTNEEAILEGARLAAAAAVARAVRVRRRARRRRRRRRSAAAAGRADRAAGREAGSARATRSRR